ncbi:hypothetical protein ES332_A06G191000v1 [Gossypium tomentosum]|uniref:Transmembrane 9 superfamily member n=1 Tax=Gossypium tomentosum TaxID=34277 RepID=A0A5D2Q5Z6_GOSTO|nr:hypothetical protein ES332_A06G191000v1 [Gossypium tomentosum]
MFIICLVGVINYLDLCSLIAYRSFASSLNLGSCILGNCVRILIISDSTSLCLLQVYYVYGFMLLVFLILIIVTVCVTIVGTYFLLNAENYHWQWTSFFSAASTIVYVYLYSAYYYYVKTETSGLFQTSFYFGYTLMFLSWFRNPLREE